MRFLATLGFIHCGIQIASAADPAPTFNKDIAPILFKNCSGCHRPGEVGPFPLLTYADAKRRAKLIAQITEQKTMPPWKPEAGHEVFKDARILSAQQIETFQAWAKAGAPEGDAKDLPKAPQFPEGWTLGKPDMIVQVKTPYKVPADGPDVYVHFVLPMELKEDKYLRAIQVLPSNRRIAHHGVPMLDNSGTARKLAKKHGGEHYPNFGGPGFLPKGFLPGYAPGQLTRENTDDDRGLVIPKGHDIVLQMHYHPSGKEEFDQPQIGLYFTDKKPERNIGVIAMANNDVDIPAGAEMHMRTDSFTLPVDFEVRDIWAHMHMIGRDVKSWAVLPGGKKKELLHIPDWDFNWQDSYRYKKPFVLPKGTVVHTEWTWNNTSEHPRNPNSPPKRIVWGEGSADEMTGLIITGIVVKPQDEGAMWIAIIAHYFEVERAANEAKKKRE